MVLQIYRDTINIIAPNIKNGGGLELLIYFLNYIEKNYNINVIIHIDKSLNDIIKLTKKRKIVLYSTNLEKIKLFTKKIKNPFYFGNLPPIRKVNNSILYIHNSYLTMNLTKLFKLSFKFFIKYGLQQLYIKLFINNCALTSCQTESMFNSIILKYKPKKIEKLPFYQECIKKDVDIKEYDFCYISMAHPHKNHKLLLKSLKLLDKYNIKCKIALTVENYRKELLDDIELINLSSNIVIKNYGTISKSEVCRIYNKSKCLVFPSSEESFGLPLIEAAKLNLDIIAPNLYYVFDVVIPTLSFEINSEKDLAMKMKEYLELEEKKEMKLLVENKIDIIIKKLVSK